MINGHLRFALMQHFSDRFSVVFLSLSLSTFRCCLSLHINLPEILCYFRGHVILFRGVFWRQQGAGGKGSLSSLLRPHTRLTNPNSHGDRFWPIACKLPWRRIATDPTRTRTQGVENVAPMNAREQKGREGDSRSSSVERNIGVCARFSTEKFDYT